MEFPKGLYRDSKPENQPAGTYRELRNGVINYEEGAIVNQRGTEELIDFGDQEDSILHHQVLDEDDFLLFIKNGTSEQTFDQTFINEDRIVRYKNNSLTTIISGDFLNFSDNYPIQSEQSRNEFEEPIVIFTDGNNPIRLINLTKDYSNITQANQDEINLIPNIKDFPNTIGSITQGGSLKTGAYQFFIAWEYSDRSISNAYSITNWLSITDSDLSSDVIDGSKGGVQTSKAIKLDLSNISTIAPNFFIYYIHRENNQIEDIQRLPRFNSESNKTINITGSESSFETSLDEILVDNVIYTSAKTMCRVDDKFYFGNLEKKKDIGYQKYANNIKSELVRKVIPISSTSKTFDLYNKPEIRNNFVGYRRDDIYAFYISFILNDGTESTAYHIPGREPAGTFEQINVSSVPIGTTSVSSTSVPIEIGSASGSGEVTLNILKDDNFVESFTIDISGVEDFTTVAQEILDSFNFNTTTSADYSLDVLNLTNHSEINIVADVAGENFNGLQLFIDSADYSIISGGSGSSNTDKTQGGSDGIGDPIVDKFVIDDESIGSNTIHDLNLSTGDSASVVALKLRDTLNGILTSTDVTISAGLDGIVTIENSHTLNFFIATNNSGTTYSYSLTEGELANIPSTDPVYDSSFDVINAVGTTTLEPKSYQFKNRKGTNGMGFWQNTNEPYPETDDFQVIDILNDGTEQVIDDLRRKPVRHHRFPSKQDEPILTTDGDNAVVLGVKFKDIKIPQSIADQVIGFKIYRADRQGNKHVIGGGVAHKSYKDSDDLLYPNITGVDENITKNRFNSAENIYYSFDHHLLRNRSTIGGITHISALNTSLQDGWMKADGGTGSFSASGSYVEDSSLVINSFRDSMENNPHILSHRDPRSINNSTIDSSNLSPNPPEFQYSLSKYFDQSTETIKPTDSEKYKVIKTKAKAYINKDSKPVELTGLGFSFDANNEDGKSAIIFELESDINLHQLLHFDFKSFKFDYYNAFYNQILIDAGYIETNINDFTVGGSHQTGSVFGGDTYLSNYYYVMTAFKTVGEWKANIHHEFIESYDNIQMRHQGETPRELYYPKSEAEDVIKPDLGDADFDYGILDNFFNYSEEYGSLPTSKPAFPFDPFDQTINQEPRKVTRTDGTNNKYRQFKELSFSELPPGNGDIVNIENLNNLLFIHTDKALYRTYGKHELQVSDIRAFIGDGDVFGQKPQQIYQEDTGYAGIQDPRHALVTKYGYFFIDQKAGEVYHLQNQIAELSSVGMQNYFESMTTDTKIRISYDPMDEIILFQRDNEEISYLPQKKIWGSFHDINPNYMLYTRHNFYSSGGSDSKLYIHKKGNPSNFYGINKPFLFKFVDNRQASINKKAININYHSRFEDINGKTLRGETFDTFRIANSYQDSGEIDLIFFDQTSGNIRPIKNRWFINKFRDMLDSNNNIDINKPWYERKRLIDTYFIVTFKYNNNGKKSLYLFNAKVKMKGYSWVS